MWLLAGLAERNILAQLAPPGVYVWQLALLTAFYLRHCHSALCGFQRLDRTVDQGRRASGVSVHGPAAAMAAAYPLRRQTDTVIARASLAPGWLHGRGHLAFLLATPFDAARLYGDFGMHAPRLFTLSHAGESCCRLVWDAYSAQHHHTRVPAPAGAAGASCRGGQIVSAPKLARAVAAL